MKQLRTAAVVSLALSALVATPALASTTGTSSTFVVAITSEGPSVTSLYNGVTLTTTSVTLGSPLTYASSSLGSMGDVLGSLGTQTQSGSSVGFWDTNRRHFWGGGPTASPIPEGRTLLLYAAGFSLVAWAALRRQRSH